MLTLQSIWGWQAALYLFLGGLGSGTCLISSALVWIDCKNNKRTIRVSMRIALGCLVLGLLLLLSELVYPVRGLLVWQSFSNPTSWMTYGAWALLVLTVLLAVMVLFSFPDFKLGSHRLSVNKHTMRRMATIPCVILSAFVATYTGCLLMSVATVPLWTTPFLPCLFVVSALASGGDAVSIVGLLVSKKHHVHRFRKFMTYCFIALVFAEGVMLVLFLTVDVRPEGAAQAEALQVSMQMLLHGRFALWFWGVFVLGGIVIPMVLSFISLRAKGDRARIMFGISAALSLIGELTLRTMIVFSGVHADFIAAAIGSMLG